MDHSRPHRSDWWCALLCVLAAGLASTLPASTAAARDEGPLDVYADAVISGKVMHSFSTAGQTVNVVLGDFSMTVGKRKMTGRDAVLWITEHRLGRQVFRDIKIYIEGDSQRKAKVVEADGTTVTDLVIMVTLRQRGRLRARVATHFVGSGESLPQYERALAMRNRPAPTLAAETIPAVIVPPDAAGGGKRPKVTGVEVLPAAVLYQPVSFRADEISSEEVSDPADPGKKMRITIAKGNAYVSQGAPDSDLFIEMRADAAVLYSQPGQPAEGGGVSEKITGAYLEGDVILRRGERTVQGSRLFYDFQHARAIILEPVMRAIQKQRNVPMYIRASEGRQIGAGLEPGRVSQKGSRWYFRDAIVTTSDFLTPGYNIAARRVYLEDATLYDAKGVAVSERRWRSRLTNATFNILSVPVLWTPRINGDAQEGHTALRKISTGKDGRFGWGAETDWYLFRLLGLPKPDGFKGNMGLNWYERGLLIEPRMRYERENYSGYARGSFMYDSEAEDDFGTDREDIKAPEQRGRLLWRHKHFLPRDWEFQTEFSYLRDRNFLEEFHPDEFWTDKRQETLLYAKKQRDNWALTILGKWRINDFLTQTEAYPDLGAYLVGQPLWGDRLSLFGEGRLGIIRLRPGTGSGIVPSDTAGRADARAEINAPFALGPIRFLPSIAGRLTSWGDSLSDGALTRPWGQVGITAMTDVWRIYNNVQSDLWNLNRIRHVVTPYGGMFWSGTDVQPDRLHPFSPDIEQNIRRLGGGTVGLRQLWQTKRGPEGKRHVADWLRLNVSASLFDADDVLLPADGRYYFYRPENSLARNAFNADAAWYISDSTIVLGDANYDIDSGTLGRADIGVTVLRDPRMEYYAGLRYIKALDSSVGTFGLNYRISRKYWLSAFQQYDFDFDGGESLSTNITLTRKFPRLYTGITFSFDRTYNDVSVILSVWPEGISEARFGGSRTGLLHRSRSRY